MKKFFKYLLLVILLSSWGIVLTNKEQTREAVRMVYEKINPPCSDPLEFSVGEINSQFGIERSEFTELAREAAEFWNLSAGKEVLTYRPEAEFRINLIFDTRQETTLEARQMESDLKSLEETHEKLTREYSSLSSAYKKRIDAYDKLLEKYKKHLKEYNEEVAYWNEKGGAPEDEYEKLDDKKADLKKEFEKIDKERKTIDKLVKETNALVSEENKIARDYNSNLNTYKTHFGEAREFEKGIFEGVAINVYQFETLEDLRLTLIHELGHYLGLDHTQNPQSIMYYLMGEQDMKTPALSQEDLNELRSVCKLEN